MSKLACLFAVTLAACFFETGSASASPSSRMLAVPEAFGAHRDHTTECEAPYVYMPEHRWRVEQPPAGAVAGNVRAVFGDMSKGILVGGGCILPHRICTYSYIAVHHAE